MSDKDCCCESCKHMLQLEECDYRNGGCKHTKLDGFICLAFRDEALACWMRGINIKTGMCEEFEHV